MVIGDLGTRAPKRGANSKESLEAHSTKRTVPCYVGQRRMGTAQSFRNGMVRRLWSEGGKNLAGQLTPQVQGAEIQAVSQSRGGVMQTIKAGAKRGEEDLTRGAMGNRFRFVPKDKAGI